MGYFMLSITATVFSKVTLLLVTLGGSVATHSLVDLRIDMMCSMTSPGSPSTGYCRTDASPDVLRCLAYQVAVERTNAGILVNGGVRFVPRFWDYCGCNSKGLKQELRILRTLSSFCDTYDNESSVALLGDFPTELAEIGVMGLEDLCIPTLASAALNSKLDEHPYFIRDTPSDKYHAEAIAELLIKMNWTLVTVVYDNTAYGTGLLHHFQGYARHANICIDCQLPLSPSANRMQTQSVAIHMESCNARVVILLLQEPIVNHLLTAANRMISNFSDIYQVITTSDLGDDLITNQRYAGTITIHPMTKLDLDFATYVENLTISRSLQSNNSVERYFAELTARRNECVLRAKADIDPGGGSQSETMTETGLKYCSGKETYGKLSYMALNMASFSIQSIHRLSRAVELLRNRSCGSNQTSNCTEFTDVLNGPALQMILHNCSQMYPNEDGIDPIGGYCRKITMGVYQLRKLESHFSLHLQLVGIFSPKDRSLSMNFTMDDENRAQSIQEAQEQCFSCPAPNQELIREVGTCCVTCSNCSSPTMFVQDDHCKECEEGSMPAPNFTICLKTEMLANESSNIRFVMVIATAVLGIIVSSGTILSVIAKRKTPFIHITGPYTMVIIAITSIVEFGLAILGSTDFNYFTCLIYGLILGLCGTVTVMLLYIKIQQFSNIRLHTYRGSLASWKKTGIVIAFCMIQVILYIILFCIKPPEIITLRLNKFPYYLDVCNWFESASFTVLVLPIILSFFVGLYALRLKRIHIRFILRETKQIICYSFLSTTGNLILAPAATFGSYNVGVLERTLFLSIYSIYLGYVQMITLLLPIIYLVFFESSHNTIGYNMAQGSHLITLNGQSIRVRFESIDESIRNQNETLTYPGVRRSSSCPVATEEGHPGIRA